MTEAPFTQKILQALYWDMQDAKLAMIVGKEVQYVSVPAEAAIESMVGMGMSEWTAKGYTELSEGFIEGFADSVTDNVLILTGHPARSFEQFATDFKQMFSG